MATADNDQTERVRREKAALRAQFRAGRRSLTDAAWRQASEALCSRLDALPELRAAQTIHVFWPDRARREPDLRPLLHAWHAEGKTLLLPRVAGTHPPRLSHHAWMPGAPLAPGAWGLDEPADHCPAHPAPPDAIVVPALAADREGFRLGYGKGFYDAFLAGQAAFFVAPLLAEVCLVERLPRDAHDVPVHAIALPGGVWRVGAGATPPPL